MLCSYAQNDRVEYPYIAQLQSLGGSIYCQHIVFFAQLLQNVFRILCGTDHHRHRINAGIVYDNGTALFQEVCSTRSASSRSKSHQNVCLSFFYDRFCYRFAVADKCYYTCPPRRRHVMHFRKLYIIAANLSDLSQHAAGQQGTRSAHTYRSSMHSFPIAAISLAKSYINLYNNYKVIYTYIKLYKILKVI